MFLEVAVADHPECRVPAPTVVDDFNPVGNGLACSITGRLALTVVDSVLSVDQNDSAIALSKHTPVRPTD